MVSLRIYLLLNTVYLCLRCVSGSPGDLLDEFVECKEICESEYTFTGLKQGASNLYQKYSFHTSIPLVYKVLLWDYKSDCDYQCQQIITQKRINENQEIYKFHGKWPFKRMFGFQEFFSSLFSIGNFIPHYRGHLFLNKQLGIFNRSESKVILYGYWYLSIAGMFAWFFSTIFHTRDLEITEKFDYFFAGATVLSGFHAIFLRVMRLDKIPKLKRIFSSGIIVIFSLHILRLYLDWCYTYNMRFNVFFGILQYVLLITLSIQNRKRLNRILIRKNSLYSNKQYFQLMFKLFTVPLLLVGFTIIAMSSELFDYFSYTWQIDSHALWHALTILPSWYMYNFFVADYVYIVNGQV